MNSTSALTITSWWICTFLCVVSTTKIQAQNNVADSLFTSGKWRDAAVFYEKQFYLSESSSEKATSLISKSNCFKTLGDYGEAYRTVKRISFENLNDTVAAKARYEAVLTAYLNGDFATAESEFLQMQFYIYDTSLYEQYFFLHALVLIEQRKWHEARQIIVSMINRSDHDREMKQSLLHETDSVFNDINYPRLRSKERAVKWATFLPGAGHIYAGYAGEGIMNVALQLASLGFTGYHIYISHYVTAFTIGTGMIQHFYFGGINRVGFLVDKKNYTLQRRYNDQLKNRILLIRQKLYEE